MCAHFRYLWVKVERYALNPDWTARKLTHNMPLPANLDLSHLKQAEGLQEGEEAIPAEVAEGKEAGAAGQPIADEAAASQSVVDAVTGMGFSENAGKRAAIATKNAGPEAAVNWVMEHMADADINDPVPVPAQGGGGAGAEGKEGDDDSVDEAAVQNLMAFGFQRDGIVLALQVRRPRFDHSYPVCLYREEVVPHTTCTLHELSTEYTELRHSS